MSPDYRYRRLGYVALNVSDLDASRDFYVSLLGLQLAEAREDICFLRCSEHHHDVILHRAERAGLRRIGWEMASADDLDRAKRHFEINHIRCHPLSTETCLELGLERGFRIIEPGTGATFEYFIGMQLAPTPFVPTVARIARLGHVVLQTDNHAPTEKFLLETLNFRASDRIEGAVTFMRCFPNSLHHSFGLSHGPARGLHHINFMVTDIDDIGKALHRLQRHGVRIVFGPGRHPPSDSVFLYFLDPDGMTVEYSFGMEEFPELGAREARLLPKTLASIDSWGAVPDREFAAQGEIAVMELTA
jgi:2,3-dihydroxy-p-cumate/2,3-dihydroxybenzoate 3,4-dioxygenase